MLLSKTDFQIASSCPKKLIYKKKNYPTANDTNEYMEMLAQGGYVVGKMAMLMSDGGIEIKGNQEGALLETERYLKMDQCILFEAAIESNNKIVRIDILKKDGKQVQIIEVKAKSFDSGNDKNKEIKELGKYIDDIVYQYYVISEKYPDFQYSCSLLMPDKSKRTDIDGLAGWFDISFVEDKTSEIEELPAREKSSFEKPNILFKYDEQIDRGYYINLLKNKGVLEYLDVTSTVVDKVADIKNRAEKYIRILNEGISEHDYSISKNCKTCDFKIKGNPNCGFMECWGNLAVPDPHIFDLYFGGILGKGNYLDELIKNGKTSLYDIDLSVISNPKSSTGVREERQLIQIQKTKTDSEWISSEFRDVLNQYQYPLHFIDFETYKGAIPFHKGMSPYELIAFQWSCHTISYKGAIPTHKEWIHTNNNFPNFQFAKALMNQIGNLGTPLMWATHENTVLKTVLNQMEIFDYNDDTLKDWLLSITKDSQMGRDGRLVDMNELTLRHYFHPEMKGQTSIKKVLPAIWNNNPKLHEISFFKKYFAKDQVGNILSPYKTLMGNFRDDDSEDALNDGTAAMKAYNDIRFNESFSQSEKQELKRQLLQYCELDTMAMVIIAHHWGLE